MPVMIQALLPVFVLILLGYLFRRWHFPGGDFWPQAERFTYYVLFPAMLIFKLGQAQVPVSAYGDILVLIVAMLAAMTLLLIALQWLGISGRYPFQFLRGPGNSRYVAWG